VLLDLERLAHPHRGRVGTGDAGDTTGLESEEREQGEGGDHQAAGHLSLSFMAWVFCRPSLAAPFGRFQLAGTPMTSPSPRGCDGCAPTIVVGPFWPPSSRGRPLCRNDLGDDASPAGGPTTIV